MDKIKSIVKSLGPGLLMAGAAIGVSHLVQSTRAGASYGYQLLWVVIAANLLKYPFFEFGHRYAVSAKESLLDGYKKMGAGFIWAFLLLNIVTSIGTMAGVTFVTGALAHSLFGDILSTTGWSAIVFVSCALILLIGRYQFLDKFMKVVMLLLFVSTISAFVAALVGGSVRPENFANPSPFTLAALPFLIALMGWMPAPVETSVWTSLWVRSKVKDEGHEMSWEMGQRDFNFGYVSTILLALIFLSLGALVMNGTGVVFSSKGGEFAGQVIDLYTQNLGSWSRPIIAFAAFSTMYSTTITCLDAYSRSMSRAAKLCDISIEEKKLYPGFMAWAALGGFIVISLFTSNIKNLVDIVTISAFLTAPVFAFMNYKLIFSDHTPAEMQPGSKVKVWCLFGMAYLVGFSLLFLGFKILV